LARLDVIDAHLGTLTSQLSDERLSRLVAADNGRLDAIDAQLRMIAVQLSDERLSGLVSRSSARDDYEELANSAAQRTAATFADAGFNGAQSRDIGEVRGMLESLINERRHNDENNASMLETMQQAIIRVLDRIDALEITQQQAMPEPAPAFTPARYEMPAMGAQYRPAPAMPASAPAMHDDLVPPTARVYAEMPPVEDHSDFLPMEQEAGAGDADYQAFRHDGEQEHAPPRLPAYTTASFDLDAAFSRSRDAEAEAFGEPQPQKRSMETLRHDFIADAHRAKLKAAAKPDASGFDPDLRAGELSVNPKDMPAKGRARRSLFSFRSQRVAMGLLVLLAAIPAAIFFMPRTSTAPTDVTPAAIESPMLMQDTAPALAPPVNVPVPDMEGAPEVAPPAMSPPPKQTKQIVPPLEKGEYEDVNATDADMDTASLPGIEMQDNDASGQQILQVNEQQRMAYLSGQLGAAAARATPAALMQEQILRNNGGSANVAADEVAPATDGTKLPPATVGPFSLRLAAGKGDASAQFEVASRLAEGKGLDQDLKEAAEWYHRSAASGFAMAQFRLGTLYERGLGVRRDAARAQSWYERAAAQGNVKAMHNLAVLAASRGPKGDYESAARWFTAAAEHGLADSQYNLAVLYENGMGVTKDMQKSYTWLLLAAKQGDKDAAERVKVLKPKMSAEDLATAKEGAAAWSAKPMKNMANDARFAGQAWREGSRRG
jgi:localization factor PodJL